MRRLVILLVLLAACKRDTQEPPNLRTRIPIIPDAITSQLGEFGFAMAVDFRGLDLKSVIDMFPDELACTKQLLASAGIGIVTLGGDEWEGRVTGVPLGVSRDCIQQLAPQFGASAKPGPGHDSIELALPTGTSALLAWTGDTVLVTQGANHPRRGEPPGVIFDLLKQVPAAGVKAWIVSSGFPQYKIKSSVAWLETSATTWTFTVIAESTEAEAAKPWLATIIDGFKLGAGAKGVKVDDAWFTLESSSITRAKLVARVPIAAFSAAAAK